MEFSLFFPPSWNLKQVDGSENSSHRAKLLNKSPLILSSEELREQIFMKTHLIQRLKLGSAFCTSNKAKKTHVRREASLRTD